ncbi:uncharacterized protein BO80DRAFT_427953 [Aspergillus ibericus CBS 121593]|uniref:Uncharacterized protein n=1 Tax=Aspergillus ibericus CBS 121593 TaxID=1448316 RepID=A0A395GQC3_9EURO|nr:hypothetical protein BO80DRAFT_427953 [Aspergillus ibericus CBS 121593]RAK97679.1 hypothetical protein BO80DRAFT_427953 [Aspergillus ibericus CBS 121593]
MLDENLPTFYLKHNKQSRLWSVYLCQHGNEPEPAYTLRYPDPSSPSSHNRYASALYDPYVSDILFGEVLIIPEWTQPSLSAESIRQNGGVAPPPEPILPSRFTINLYNPDQQVTVHFKPKTWNSPATWNFEMPQHSFRQPSASTLDRTQTDPAMADTTPKLRFTWRKDSKLSKDLTCYLSGKTTTLPESKTKSKEPDITVSIFKSLRELTLYEPNLYRVEMEDFKGLEVVLLLGAITIRDVYFASMKDAFHVTKPAHMSSTPSPTKADGKPLPTLPAASGALNAVQPRPEPQPQQPPQPPPTTTRKTQQQLEEERRTQQLLQEEEQARRRRRAERQAEIDRETRRLQMLYGQEEEQVRMQTPSLPPRQHPATTLPLRPANQPHYSYPYQDGRRPPAGPYMSPGLDPRRQSAVRFALPQEPPGPAASTPALQPKKSSFFRLRRSSTDEAKLSKKRSSMF